MTLFSVDRHCCLAMLGHSHLIFSAIIWGPLGCFLIFLQDFGSQVQFFLSAITLTFIQMTRLATCFWSIGLCPRPPSYPWSHNHFKYLLVGTYCAPDPRMSALPVFPVSSHQANHPLLLSFPVPPVKITELSQMVCTWSYNSHSWLGFWDCLKTPLPISSGFLSPFPLVVQDSQATTDPMLHPCFPKKTEAIKHKPTSSLPLHLCASASFFTAQRQNMTGLHRSAFCLVDLALPLLAPYFLHSVSTGSLAGLRL